MSWREAFLRQARSEHEVRRRLGDLGVEYSHRLHYLQMVAEKLSKGMQAAPGHTDAPQLTHHSFVRLLQVLKRRPELRRQLGYIDADVFRRFIDSILDLANQVQRLAPSGELTQANPEYPWRDPVTGIVRAPVDYSFDLFDPRNPRMIKLEKLLDALLRIAA